MERSVIVIVPDIDDVYQASLGTICTFIERGDATHVLVVEYGRFRTEEERLSLKDQCKGVGISDVFSLDGFDYSCVTQNNADLISAVIQKVNPSIVIMPYWRSANFSRKILAKCALIACRGIGTILMYAMDSENDPNYSPTVSVRISPEAAQIKQQFANDRLHLGSFHPELKVRKEDDLFLSSRVAGGREECNAYPIDDEGIIGNDRNNSIQSRHITGEDRDANYDTLPSLELFVSHRMLLVSDETGW
jgi:hypothetical protein